MKLMSKDMELPVRENPTLGCCGLDCGLCPRYHAVNGAGCPGCCGTGFFDRRTPCPFLSCAVKRKKVESCAECDEVPCPKFKGGGRRDSFVTKQRCMSNLQQIRETGLERFLEQQRGRMGLLERMLEEFNEGRSKGFYCLAATLLPMTTLTSSLHEAEQEIMSNNIRPEDVKAKAGILRRLLNKAAEERGIELRLRDR